MEGPNPEKKPSPKTEGRDADQTEESFDSRFSSQVKEWLKQNPTGYSEFVIQAEVPKPQVRFETQAKFPMISEFAPHSQLAKKDDILDQLQKSILEIVTEAVLLRAAASISVKAEKQQLLRIARLPNIRSILPNRRRRKP